MRAFWVAATREKIATFQLRVRTQLWRAHTYENHQKNHDIFSIISAIDSPNARAHLHAGGIFSYLITYKLPHVSYLTFPLGHRVRRRVRITPYHRSYLRVNLRVNMADFWVGNAFKIDHKIGTKQAQNEYI